MTGYIIAIVVAAYAVFTDWEYRKRCRDYDALIDKIDRTIHRLIPPAS